MGEDDLSLAWDGLQWDLCVIQHLEATWECSDGQDSQSWWSCVLWFQALNKQLYYAPLLETRKIGIL